VGAFDAAALRGNEAERVDLDLSHAVQLLDLVDDLLGGDEVVTVVGRLAVGDEIEAVGLGGELEGDVEGDVRAGDAVRLEVLDVLLERGEVGGGELVEARLLP